MKKKKFFILPILYCCIAVQAQTSSKNYLLEKQMLDVSDNQILSISDKAGSLLYDGSFDFKDGASESTEYFYNANGALTKDLNTIPKAALQWYQFADTIILWQCNFSQ